MPSPPIDPPLSLPFIQALAALGWIEGKTIQVERRYVGDTADQVATPKGQRRLSSSGRTLSLRRPVRLLTQSAAKPGPFNNPLAADFVASLAHPGGNITGFANVEPTTIGKMIELLKTVAPRTRAIALKYGNTYVNFKRDWIMSQETMDQAAKTYSVELLGTPVASEADIDRAFAKFGADQTTAVMILADVYLLGQRNPVVASAARYRVPTIFPVPVFPAVGGLMSYGGNFPDQFRQAAGYVDRISKGRKSRRSSREDADQV